MREMSSPELLAAPPCSAFPEYPASWYFLCESRDLRDKPYARAMLGRNLVAFRTEGGEVSVLDGHCAHQGADLGCGRIRGSTIQCPFHHWRYESDGACMEIPGAREIPSWARLRRYPAIERHGSIFVFNGSRPLFPLPFLLGEDQDAYVASAPFRYVADCSWYTNAAHAFDTRHFLAVHDRELMGPVEIDCPTPFARRNTYLAKVIGGTLFDRILRILAGGTARTSLTIWGGTFAVVTADFPRARSAFLISMLPLCSDPAEVTPIHG